MIAANRIKFQKIFSNELNIPDLIMECAFDSDSSEVSTYLNREAVSVESHDGRRNNTIRYKYSERFSPRFTFIKKGFGDFSSSELRTVLKWLTSSDTPTVLDVYYDNSNVVGFSAVGNWTQIDSYKLANSRTVAVVATFESIHPFAFSDVYTITKTISDPADNKITIDIDTDDNKPIYPRITIKHNGSIVKIPADSEYTKFTNMVENTVYYNEATNTYYWKTPDVLSSVEKPDNGYEIVEMEGSYSSSDVFAENTLYYYIDSEMYYWLDPKRFHKESESPTLPLTSVRLRNSYTDLLNKNKTISPIIVKNNTPTEMVIIDGANRIVSSDRTRRIFGGDFNWQWLELYDGKNEITVEGNCDIKIEYREPRKLGEW